MTEQAEQLESDWMRWAGFDGGELAMELLTDCFSRLTERAMLALRLRLGTMLADKKLLFSWGFPNMAPKNLMQRAKSQLKECVESRLQ